MNPRLGILMGVAGYFFFAMQDASNKWLVASLPVWEVMFVRSLVIVVACVVLGRQKLVVRLAVTPLRGKLAFRAVLTLVAWLCYYTAARELPLAQLLTLYFAAPIMMMAMAGPLLGEVVTRWQWVSVWIGFAGVLVASDPFGVRVSWATLLVLVASTFWALSAVLTRQIARRESTMIQMLAANVVFTVATGAMCLVSWTPPDDFSWVLLLSVGVLGGLGQYFTFGSARLAPASVMAPVEYSALLWAFILGFVIWGDVPRVPVWIGAGLIVCAGIVLVWSTRRPRGAGL